MAVMLFKSHTLYDLPKTDPSNLGEGLKGSGGLPFQDYKVKSFWDGSPEKDQLKSLSRKVNLA